MASARSCCDGDMVERADREHPAVRDRHRLGDAARGSMVTDAPAEVWARVVYGGTPDG